MDSNSCVKRIDRFTSRRGTPSMIRFYNGTHSVGAKAELRLHFEKLNTNNIAAEVAHNGKKRRFNPVRHILVV